MREVVVEVGLPLGHRERCARSSDLASAVRVGWMPGSCDPAVDAARLALVTQARRA